MDISPGGALFVTGDEKGLIKVGDAKSGTTRVCIKFASYNELSLPPILNILLIS